MYYVRVTALGAAQNSLAGRSFPTSVLKYGRSIWLRFIRCFFSLKNSGFRQRILHDFIRDVVVF